MPKSLQLHCVQPSGQWQAPIEKVDYVAFYDKPFVKFERLLSFKGLEVLLPLICESESETESTEYLSSPTSSSSSTLRFFFIFIGDSEAFLPPFLFLN